MKGSEALHLVGTIFGLSTPRTQTTGEERAALARHLPGRRNILEIGVFEGFTTKLLADNADADATIYGVDPFFPGSLGISYGELITRRSNRANIASGKVHIIKSLSANAGSIVPETLDFIFIDADHSLEGIRADWNLWSERVSIGGVMALHDTIPTSDRPEYGSHEFYRDVIQHDNRFHLTEKVHSLAILIRVC